MRATFEYDPESGRSVTWLKINPVGEESQGKVPIPKVGSRSLLWHHNGESCSLRLACARTNPDGTAVLFEDLLANPKAKPISRHTFGREEGLK
jgi:hypothetical protein